MKQEQKLMSLQYRGATGVFLRGRRRYRVFIKYCVFFRIFKNILDSVFPRCQCVYTPQAGRNPALQQNWQSSEKSQNFKEKTQYLMNILQLLDLGYAPNKLFLPQIEQPANRKKNPKMQIEKVVKFFSNIINFISNIFSF